MRSIPEFGMDAATAKREHLNGSAGQRDSAPQFGSDKSDWLWSTSPGGECLDRAFKLLAAW